MCLWKHACICILAASVWGVLSVRAKAQQQRDTTPIPSQDLLSMGFERNVNTFLWDLRGSYFVDADGWEARTTERFQRTLIQSDRVSIKDDQTFALYLGRKLTPIIQIVASFNSFLFSDNRALGLSDLSNNKALVGTAWHPFPELYISPLAGYSFDNQQSVHDDGLMYSGSALLQNFRVGGYRFSGEGFISAEYLDPRFQNEQRFLGNVVAEFSPSSVNTTQFSFKSMRRDLYLSYDSLLSERFAIAFPIESRDEQIVYFADQLRYEADRSLTFQAALDMTQRDIRKRRKYRSTDIASSTFDANIDEFRLTATGSMQYENNHGTRGSLRIYLNERNETHTLEKYDGYNTVTFAQQARLEEQKNNSIMQTQLAMSLSIPLSASDTISVSGSTVKLVYDTPSSTNVDDRDELFVLTGFRFVHRFSNAFIAALTSDVNLRHSVYLFSQKSANNTWNRVFRLKPSTEYRYDDKVITKNSGEVVANYTVYDFEAKNPSLQSFSLRQLSLSDSTAFRISKRLWIQTQTHLRFYERGEVRWTSFTMKPLSYIDERTISLSFLYVTPSLSTALGFRSFTQTRFKYIGSTKESDGILSNYGPICQVSISVGKTVHLFIDGWYQVTKASGGGTRRTPTLSSNLIWNL